MPNIHKENNKWKTLKEFSKSNRKNQTYTEQIIWNLVRNNRLGVRFKRQYIYYDFILDFICISKKLVIEIDGSSHDKKVEYDLFRQKLLESNGFNVIRFTNNEVTDNRNIVEKKIKESININC